MKVSISLSPRRIGLTLAFCGLAIALINLGFEMVGQVANIEYLWPISRQFDFGEEGNFANWYQSVTLLLCSVIILAIARVLGQTGQPFRKHWLGLAFVFLFVSIDEAAQIHETTVAILIEEWRHRGEPASHTSRPTSEAAAAKQAAPKDERPDSEVKSTWMTVYLVVFAILVGIFLKFFLQLPPRIRVFFVLAAILYIGGAIFVERILGKISDRAGDSALLSEVFDNISELMEMLGVAAFAYALLTYLGQITSAFDVRVEPAKVAE